MLLIKRNISDCQHHMLKKKDLPTIHKQISFPNIFLNSFTQFFTCKKSRSLFSLDILLAQALQN